MRAHDDLDDRGEPCLVVVALHPDEARALIESAALVETIFGDEVAHAEAAPAILCAHIALEAACDRAGVSYLSPRSLASEDVIE